MPFVVIRVVALAGPPAAREVCQRSQRPPVAAQELRHTLGLTAILSKSDRLLARAQATPHLPINTAWM